jgi:tetratricopeptide (TPR) repeat protein
LLGQPTPEYSYRDLLPHTSLRLIQVVKRSKLRPFYVTALAICLLAVGRAGWVEAAGEFELNEGYKALALEDYDRAIALFRKGLALQPSRAGTHKDLAYALVKVGENEAARDEFETAMRLNPADENAALEFAFLAFETKKPVDARRTFDRLRQSKNPETRKTAERAFQNIDKPLADGIARWQDALKRASHPDDLSFYSAHWELAQLAELRDELPLAAEQYEICRKLKPQLSELLLIEARVWRSLNRLEEANAAVLAASRSVDSRTAEQALEQVGKRYPYPYEFVGALKLDSRNVKLRRELAYLYLAMGKEAEAKAEFQRVLEIAPEDQLAREQLNAILGLKTRPPATAPSTAAPAPAPAPVSAKVMGKKSLDLGYVNDAIKYLRLAHEQDPDDAEVALKLGYAYNLAKNDADAISWFDLARHADNQFVAVEAAKAFHNLRGDPVPQTTLWLLPMYSTRWHDLFTYGQIKRTIPLPLGRANRLLSFYISNRLTEISGGGSKLRSEAGIFRKVPSSWPAVSPPKPGIT